MRLLSPFLAVVSLAYGVTIQDLGSVNAAPPFNGAAWGAAPTGDYVTGWSGGGFPGSAMLAYSWSPESGLVALPTLGGLSAWGRDVNHHGRVAGYSETASGNVLAFVYVPGGAMAPIGTLGGADSFGMAINNAGSVAGYAETGTGTMHAFNYWADGAVMWDLGTLGGANSYGYGINEYNYVAGQADLADGRSHAFRFVNSMEDLGTLGSGRNSAARAINVARDYEVVGWSEFLNGSTARHAFKYSAGTMIDMDPLGLWQWSEATAINNGGTSVGWGYDSQWRKRAFWYTTSMVDLNLYLSLEQSSEWVLTEAWGIDDGNAIVGTGLHNGVGKPFRLVFEPGWDEDLGGGQAGGVDNPEPATIGLMFGAMTLLVYWRKRVG